MDLLYGISMSAYRVDYTDDEARVHVDHQAGVGCGREAAVREKTMATCLEVWPVAEGYTGHDVRMKPVPRTWLSGKEDA